MTHDSFNVNKESKLTLFKQILIYQFTTFDPRIDSFLYINPVSPCTFLSHLHYPDK